MCHYFCRGDRGQGRSRHPRSKIWYSFYMKLILIPKTTLGRWSIGLIIAMSVLFFIVPFSISFLYKSVPAGNTILEDIVKRPVLALGMLAAMISGISAFVIGLTAIIKRKDRSLLVYVATTIGFLLILFLLGEFLSPH